MNHLFSYPTFLYYEVPMRLLLLLSVALLFGPIGCGPKAVENDEAPVRENVVFPLEYAAASLAWRADSHQVFITFTDDWNYSEEDVTKWTVKDFCSRAAADRTSRTVHLVWSGKLTSKGTPQGASGDAGTWNEDPFGAADCTSGTTKIIDSEAADLDLSTLPVTKALQGSVLVEYLTETPDTETEVTVVIKTATADGEAKFTRKLANALSTKTVEDSVNGDIPEDASVDVPTPTLNNVTPKAEFSQVAGNPGRIQLNFLGLTDPTTGNTMQLVANESLFVADGESRLQKGIKITADEGNSLPVDIVFAIDNSGSMGPEHDKIAEKISDFAAALAKSGLDAKFSVVGFNGGITGAIDFTDAAGIKTFLDRDTGTMRSGGFEGSNSGDLESKAGTFDL
jgi:hypothetical protein